MSLASLPPRLTLSLKQRDKGAAVSAQVNPGSGILTMGEPHKPSGCRPEVEGLSRQGPRDPSLTTGLWLLLLQIHTLDLYTLDTVCPQIHIPRS